MMHTTAGAQVIGDVAYFGQQTSSGIFSLYAYNASNATLWMVSGSNANRGVAVTIDGVLYGSRGLQFSSRWLYTLGAQP